MDGNDIGLARLRAVLTSALHIIDRMQDDDLSPEEMALFSTSVELVRSWRPRSKADVARWVEAYHGGDEGWLILRSVPGGGAEARYFASLPPEIARLFK